MKEELPKPKIGLYLERIGDILGSDRDLPKKQRHTAKRVYERIKEEGYEGRNTQVKEAVRELKWQGREVFTPLIHTPGEAQVDFGFSLAKVSRELWRVLLYAMVWPYLDVRLKKLGITLLAPYRKNPTNHVNQNAKIQPRYSRRWVFERTIGWIGRFKRLVIRYENKLTMYTAFFHLPCAMIVLRKCMEF